jgi:hypothetical protein
MPPETQIHMTEMLHNIPAKVTVAFNALAYCRSITDPNNRPLSTLERGMEIAALNLLRDWLNGEILLNVGHQSIATTLDASLAATPHTNPQANDEEDPGQLAA